MGKTTKYRTPPLCESKLLCTSLLYLVSVMFIGVYNALSPTKCLFRSSPFDPIQAPLFSYPSTYGVHNHALPTHRPSCSSPVFFSNYWPVLEEIQNLCRNDSAFATDLRYMKEEGDTFGGTFSTHRRLSNFNHSTYNGTVELPCGFFKKFSISSSDRIEMENCNGVVVASAIFNDHDKIRQPKGLGSRTLDSVCFFMFIDDVTLEEFQYHQLVPREVQDYKVGAWRIVKVSRKNLYSNPAKNVVIPKYLVHRLFPNSKFSIWINAQLQLMVDPLLLIHTLVLVENVDMAIPKHPLFIHTMEEAMATARWKKWWDVESLQRQMETYCKNGLQPWSSNKPYPTDVPNTAVILRKHGLGTNLFSCLLYNELEAFNPRDQLPFAYVRDLMSPRLKLNMFEEEVFEQIAAEYRHNLKSVGSNMSDQQVSTIRRTKRAKQDLIVNSSCCSRCQNYLSELWDETH